MNRLLLSQGNSYVPLMLDGLKDGRIKWYSNSDSYLDKDLKDVIELSKIFGRKIAINLYLTYHL